MKNFERGIAWYTKATGEITVNFPEDQVLCRWCKSFLKYEEYFKRYSCRLTDEWILDPFHSIGMLCPLKLLKENEVEK